MANHDSTAVREDLPEGVFTERRINGVVDGIPYGNPAANTPVNMLSVEELRQRNDSLIENIGALRFSIARIEQLELQRAMMVALLEDIRQVLKDNGAFDLDVRVVALLVEIKE
jgi:uncharacterized protein (UPF0335 family)